MPYFRLDALKKVLKIGKPVNFYLLCRDPKLARVAGGYGINFQKAHDDFKNIALQISPRGNSSYVVLNSRINGKWQTEEHVRYNDQKSMQDIFFKNPLELSMQPEKDNHTLISFNGSLVTGFNCKVDLTEAKYLVLSHDIELQHSKYDSNNTGTDISHGLDNEEDGTYSDRISQDSDDEL